MKTAKAIRKPTRINFKRQPLISFTMTMRAIMPTTPIKTHVIISIVRQVYWQALGVSIQVPTSWPSIRVVAIAAANFSWNQASDWAADWAAHLWQSYLWIIRVTPFIFINNWFLISSGYSGVLLIGPIKKKPSPTSSRIPPPCPGIVILATATARRVSSPLDS